MTLSEKINNDLKEAMKCKDSFRLSVIRMVKGAMQLAKPNPREELTDDDVIAVISKQIKMRNDAVKEFESAGRDDLAEQNRREIEILNTYMPKQLSTEELTEIIDKVFNEVKPTSQKDMGLIMKNISPLVKGKADMSLVNKLVKERLG
ncbi:MAG: GatB/YqeY domain-containing protein [Bacilli bacterium]